MRERLLLFAILVASAALAAFLVLPRKRLSFEPLPSDVGQETGVASTPLEASAPRASTFALPSTVDRGSAFAFVPSATPVASAPPPPPPAYVRVDSESLAACGDGMVLVDGIYCPYVGHICKSFLNEKRDM